MVKRGKLNSPKMESLVKPPSRGTPKTKSAISKSSCKSTSSVDTSGEGTTKGGSRTAASRESRRSSALSGRTSQAEHKKVTIMSEEMQALGLRMLDMSSQGMTVLQNSLYQSTYWGHGLINIRVKYCMLGCRQSTYVGRRSQCK